MKRFIENNEDKTYDLIVVGGGITGGAVAYDAAKRGLSVAVVEKNDFGWATSAATSKLIHGGLRYLNNLEFGLVRESLMERRILEDIAPNFVYPLGFVFPHYKLFKTSRLLIRTGLTLYDILAFDKKKTKDVSKAIPNHKWLSKKTTLEMEPDLKKENLKGGSIYYDCRSIAPERLTLGFIKSAEKYGANLANHAEVVSFVYSDKNKISGVKVKDTINNVEKEIKGKLVVNCAGPWADIVLNIADKSDTTHSIKRSEGIHILTKKKIFNNPVVLITPEGRHFFTIPWRGKSLIGTTDNPYEGDPDDYKVSKVAIDSIIKDINDSFGGSTLSFDDVEYTYGGLRPLVDTDTEETYDSSRKYEIYDNAKDGMDGLITVEGGKYTTSRHLADTVVKMALPKLGKKIEKTTTREGYLAGSEIEDMEAFMSVVHTNYKDQFSVETIEYIARHYGTECHSVFELAKNDKSLKEVINRDGEILAQVIYAIKSEMALTLDDIFFRRTGIGAFGEFTPATLNKIADIAGKELGWDDKRKKAEVEVINKKRELPK